jgi:hypothetical protein
MDCSLDNEQVGLFCLLFFLVVAYGLYFNSLRCDEIDLETSKPKKLSEPRATYAHAQKMRAAMSHKFGRELERGTVPWTEHPVQPGKYVGNPSLSPKVSQYMVSLQRRKVWFGFPIMVRDRKSRLHILFI